MMQKWVGGRDVLAVRLNPTLPPALGEPMTFRDIQFGLRGRKRRRGLSAKKRFRILNRDGFTCRYCGQAAPYVVLHVDHITPVCNGGDDDDDNLVAACEDCNAGKSADDIINHTEKHQQQLYCLLRPYLEWSDDQRNSAITTIARAYSCGYEYSDLLEIGRIAESVREVELLFDWLLKQGVEE